MTTRSLLLGALLAAAIWPSPVVAEEPDLRGVELLDYDCRSDLGRRAVTLFANGTVRLRRGPPDEEKIFLAELTPDELEAYVRRLEAENLAETDLDSSSVSGDWVERCTLDLELPERVERHFVLDRYTPLSLALSRVVAIARELGEWVEEESPSDRRLPTGYEARAGDVLERLDGVHYRVVGFTAGGKGVELQGVDQPFTLYVRADDLRREFVALISRR